MGVMQRNINAIKIVLMNNLKFSISIRNKLIIMITYNAIETGERMYESSSAIVFLYFIVFWGKYQSYL
jgi:hypothetical protein